MPADRHYKNSMLYSTSKNSVAVSVSSVIISICSFVRLIRIIQYTAARTDSRPITIRLSLS